MQFYLVNATTDLIIQRINMRFLCTEVVGLKLAPPLSKEKTVKLRIQVGQSSK